MFHDDALLDAGKGRVGREAVAEAVGSVELRIETDFRHVTFHDEIHAFVGKAFRRDFSGLGNAAEEGTFVDAGRREPML